MSNLSEGDLAMSRGHCALLKVSVKRKKLFSFGGFRLFFNFYVEPPNQMCHGKFFLNRLFLNENPHSVFSSSQLFKRVRPSVRLSIDPSVSPLRHLKNAFRAPILFLVQMICNFISLSKILVTLLLFCRISQQIAFPITQQWVGWSVYGFHICLTFGGYFIVSPTKPHASSWSLKCIPDIVFEWATATD